MINFIKNNKILSTLIIINIIILIISIYASITLDNNSKEQIHNNIIKLVNEYSNNNISTSTNFIKQILKNISLTTLIWLLGISVIGIPINICIYSLYTYIDMLEIIFLFNKVKEIGIIFIFLFSIINIINIIIIFITLFYSITYSFILIRYLINKANYNIKKITKKYIKVLLINNLLVTITSILEIFIIPKIYLFFK